LFRKLRDRAQIRTGTPHVLRHTAATIALTEGIPVHIVAARLRRRRDGPTNSRRPSATQRRACSWADRRRADRRFL